LVSLFTLQTAEFTEGCGESQRNCVEKEVFVYKCQVHNTKRWWAQRWAIPNLTEIQKCLPNFSC